MVFAKIAAWQKPHEVSNQLAQVLAGVFPNPMAPSSDTLEALFPHLAHNQKQNKQNTFPRRLLTDKSYSKITMQGRNSHSTMPHTLWSSNHKRNFPFIRLTPFFFSTPKMWLSVILLVITYHVIMYNVTAFNQFLEAKQKWRGDGWKGLPEPWLRDSPSFKSLILLPTLFSLQLTWNLFKF